MNQHQARRVLIIDDSLDIQGLLRTILESKGYKVDCTSNGAEALSLLESLRVLPDVILLDLRMPVMDGFGFLNSQRKCPRFRNIPTVIMSADADSESARHKTRSQCDLKSPDLLMKPLTMKSVITAVERNIYLH